MTKSSERGRQTASRTGHRTSSSPNMTRSTRDSRPGYGKRVYRNPFRGTRKCKYQHRRCVYDPHLRKCREQLTPVTEVSTPESSVRGISSASTISSRKSRPGTPIGFPGSAERVPTPDCYSDNEDSYVQEEENLPGFIPDSGQSVTTTLKATATVTLELTSGSAKPYRVTRLHTQNEWMGLSLNRDTYPFVDVKNNITQR